MTPTLPRGATADGASRSTAARRRAALAARGTRLLAAADELLGDEPGPLDDRPDDLDAAGARIDVASASVVEALGAGGGDPAALGHLLVELQAYRSDLREHEHAERRDRLAAAEAGLAPLRWVHDPRELLARVCEALVTSCGFDRAMLSRVEGPTWRPWKSFAATEREHEPRFREWISANPEIPLDHLLLENEMVRRQAPAIVSSPEDPRVYAPLAEASGLTSYVAAPLVPTGRVIGFLHADHAGGPVSDVDRDVLWAFAESFGHLFERAVLLNRLAEQREQVSRAMDTVASVLSELATAEIELAARAPGPVARPRPAVDETARVQGSRIEALLTARELEVLTLMATGATNARIAEELVISDATVKSHVKRILRKLRAGNRAEAIARYLRLTMGGGEPA